MSKWSWLKKRARKSGQTIGCTTARTADDSFFERYEKKKNGCAHAGMGRVNKDVLKRHIYLRAAACSLGEKTDPPRRLQLDRLLKRDAKRTLPEHLWRPG
jgi:hypothetical protein